jgi:hypothetical protein
MSSLEPIWYLESSANDVPYVTPRFDPDDIALSVDTNQTQSRASETGVIASGVCHQVFAGRQCVHVQEHVGTSSRARSWYSEESAHR